MIPPFGVYVTRTKVDGVWYKSVSNIGRKPTVGADNPIGLETFLLDFDKDVYEQNILVEFLDFIRPEKRFESLEALKHQIFCDIETTHKYYENITKVC